MTRVTRFFAAEEVGFEPTVPVDTAVFETARFGRSRTPPSKSLQRTAGPASGRYGRAGVGLVRYETPYSSDEGKRYGVAEPTLDDAFMRQALDAAHEATQHDDVPVGCVLVKDSVIIAVGENRREIDQDPTAHAEVVALRRAATSLSSWRMDDVTAYVTLEPCVMCAGALLNARVGRLVIGALDEKAGAVGSRYNLLSDPRLLHEVGVTYDVLASSSVELLQAFFTTRRS